MLRDFSTALTWLVFLAEVAVLLRALLHSQREPASRIAWFIAILVLPLVGALFYLLIGEARVSRRRRARFAAIDAQLHRPDGDPEAARALSVGPYAAPFALARAVNGLPPTLGNKASLAADNRAAIAGMVADIEAARETVHLCFYIWLADESGLAIKAALLRAGATPRPTHREAAFAALPRPLPLQADYKRQTYRATLLRDDTVKLGGVIYPSLSAAAVSIVHRNMNGWWFWKYRSREGHWVRLVELGTDAG